MVGYRQEAPTGEGCLRRAAAGGSPTGLSLRDLPIGGRHRPDPPLVLTCVEDSPTPLTCPDPSHLKRPSCAPPERFPLDNPHPCWLTAWADCDDGSLLGCIASL